MRIEIDRLQDGRKRFKGRLAGVRHDEGESLVAIALEGEAEPVRLAFREIVEAKLIITDALMARGAALRAERLAQEQSSSIQPEPILREDTSS